MLMKSPGFIISALALLFVQCNPIEMESDALLDAHPIEVNATQHYRFKDEILKQIVLGNNGAALPYGIENVMAKKIIYTTASPDNQPKEASGILLIPENISEKVILLYLHSAITDPKKASSLSLLGNNELLRAAILASTGFITLIPDYMGYGASSDVPHLFEHKKSLVQSNYDFLWAVHQYLKQNKITSLNKLFILGYGEGAYSSLVLQQKIEETLQFQILHTYAGGGVYNKSRFITSLFETEKNTNALGNFVRLLISYNRNYKRLNRPLSYYFNPPYSHQIETIINENGILKDSMVTGITVRELFTKEFIDGVLEKTDRTYLEVVQENDISDWKPKTPITLYRGSLDQVTAYANTLKTVKEIELLGGQITYEGILGKNHELAQWPFLFDVIHQIKNFNAN
jgi:hypothetical protein